MEKTEVVAKIIEYVGGKDNVVNTWHCMTRLRFELKDTSKIQEDAIKALDGVIGVQFAKGQLQIVLGTSVHKYYDIALQMLDLKEDIAAPAQPEKKKDFISWFMDMVSGVFGPIVPAIAGAGMIKRTRQTEHHKREFTCHKTRCVNGKFRCVRVGKLCKEYILCTVYCLTCNLH